MQHLIDEIRRYLDAKSIPNVTYQDLKRRAERAWERDRRSVGGPRSIDPTWTDVPWTAIPESIRVAYDNVRVLMLHHVATRKLARVTDDSRGQRYNDLIERWRPVSIGLRDLKQYAVKRRARREGPVADDAARRTCQVCGRKILLVGGRIAHHGFERPGNGQQTASCYGVVVSFEDGDVLERYIHDGRIALWPSREDAEAYCARLVSLGGYYRGRPVPLPHIPTD